jgi:hypothetical protein
MIKTADKKSVVENGARLVLSFPYVNRFEVVIGHIVLCSDCVLYHTATGPQVSGLLREVSI